MKRNLLQFIFISILSVSVYGQKASFVNIDAGLLRSKGDFFKLYNGIVDVGAGYHISILKEFYGGLHFNAGFLNYKNTPARTNLFRPKISLLYTIHLSPRIAIDPLLGIGYTFVRITNDEYAYATTQSGLNYSGKIKMRWKSTGKLDYYLFGSYDFIYLDKDESFTLLNSFRQIQLLTIGLGVNIKSGIYE